MKLFNKVFSLILFTALITSTAFAISLDDAKAKGLVGEDQSGYLGAVQGSSEINALVADINSKRKQKYQEIASKNGTALASVEALAGKKAIENTASGQFIKPSGSGWKRK